MYENYFDLPAILGGGVLFFLGNKLHFMFFNIRWIKQLSKNAFYFVNILIGQTV